MAMKKTTWVGVGFIVGLLVGVLCSLAPALREAEAAPQTFGPEQMKNVARDFIDGGDRNYTVLKEILAEMRLNRASAERIDRRLTRIEASFERTLVAPC